MADPSEYSNVLNLYNQWLSIQNQMLMDTLWINHLILKTTNQNQQKVNEISLCTSESEKIATEEQELKKIVVKIQSSKKEYTERKLEQKKKKEGKDGNFYPKKQKNDRNVISNLVHHLLKYLYQKDQVAKYLQKIIALHHLSITIDRFYQILDIFNYKMKSYVTEVYFKDLLIGKSQQIRKNDQKEVRQFSKILRIVCNKFYKKQCFQSIIYSVKLTFQSKDLHYIGMRQIRTLINFLSDEENKSEST